MVSVPGQQKGHLPPLFDGRDPPPHFPRYDDSPEARGFVELSLLRGLRPVLLPRDGWFARGGSPTPPSSSPGHLS
jgi:hypothetical protein